MKKQIYKTTEIIGDTPLIEIDWKFNSNRILAKLETHSLTGSIKDRMALYMLEQAQNKGLVKKNTTIVEATTGNTGIAFAALGAIYGYKVIIVMPEDVSRERRKLIKQYGAELVLTSKNKGPAGAIEKRNYIAEKLNNVWVPSQFSNADNIKAHINGIAKEILEQSDGKIDYFVHGIGTGGTFIGIAKVLKKANSNIQTIAVEPEESAVLRGGKPGEHGIQGIGEGFIPVIVNKKYINKVIRVSTEEAIKETKKLASKQGLLVGISSGANIAAIKKLSRIVEGKTILTILADRGERYLSVL